MFCDSLAPLLYFTCVPSLHLKSCSSRHQADSIVTHCAERPPRKYKYDTPSDRTARPNSMCLTTSLRHFLVLFFSFPRVFLVAFLTQGEARLRCRTRTRQLMPGVKTPPQELHNDSDTHSGRRGPLPVANGEAQNMQAGEMNVAFSATGKNVERG